MLICTRNLLDCKEDWEQEIAALENIERDYKNKKYNNMYILIMNYLGHIDHYCGHEGLVDRLLNNFTYSLEKEAKGELTEENDNFLSFVRGRIKEIKFDIENGYL